VRGAAPGAGYRNGYRTGRLKTAEGMVEYAVPQICDRAAPFRSRLREIIRGRSEELEALAVEMYARGLSTRDIEALFADERPGDNITGVSFLINELAAKKRPRAASCLVSAIPISLHARS
jgi:transposase-like protein